MKSIDNVYEKGLWKNRESMHPGGVKLTKEILVKSKVENGRVLDIGCGKGSTIKVLSKMGFDIYGVDYSDKFISVNKKRYSNGIFYKHDLNEIKKLPFKENFFDIIIAECVINLIKNKAFLINEIKRILKPKGKLLLNDLATLKSKNFERILTIESWRKILLDSGLEIELMEEKRDEIKEFILGNIWNGNSFCENNCVPDGCNIYNLTYFSCISRKS